MRKRPLIILAVILLGVTLIAGWSALITAWLNGGCN